MIGRWARDIKNVLRGISPLLAMVRWVRQLRDKDAGGKKELRSADGAIYTGVPVFEPCSLDWWKNSLQQQEVQFSFRSIGAVPSRATKMMPKLLAFLLDRSFLMLSLLFPHTMITLSQYYHIRVCKPIHVECDTQW